MKKIIGFIFLFIVVLIAGVYFAKDFVLKEILERRLTKMNNAPVVIKSVNLSPFDNYITVKDIKIASTVDKESQFITIDEFKSYYSIDYLNRVVKLDDTEIDNIVFFEKEIENEANVSTKNDIFIDKISEVEEQFKKDQVVTELRNLYLEKIDVDTAKIDEAVQDKIFKLELIHNQITKVTESDSFENIKNSFKKLKDIKKNKDNISNILNELSNLGKSAKEITRNTNLEDLKSQFRDLRKNEEFKELLDNIVKEFLNKNKFVLIDLDTYINLYLNAVYEEKIYEIYLKYLKLISEIDRRKFLENIDENKDDWELYFDSISLTSNMYGIKFNGEITNLSSKISQNTGNINFKLFGEKGQTIGELRGYLNLAKYQIHTTLNIPEVNSVDFSTEIFIGGEGTINQYLYTDNYFLETEGTMYFKNLQINGEKLANSMKINDDLVKELVIPILGELKGGQVSYKYDTKSRKLNIKTDLVDIFEKIINDDNSSLKIKMREKIKEKYLDKLSA